MIFAIAGPTSGHWALVANGPTQLPCLQKPELTPLVLTMAKSGHSACTDECPILRESGHAVKGGRDQPTNFVPMLCMQLKFYLTLTVLSLVAAAFFAKPALAQVVLLPSGNFENDFE